MSGLKYSLLTRVFTRAILAAFSNKRMIDNVVFSAAVNEFISCPQTKTYADIFEDLFDILRQEYCRLSDGSV